MQVIDDDLGRSANGGSTRHGFEKLLARICEVWASSCRLKPRVSRATDMNGIHIA